MDLTTGLDLMNKDIIFVTGGAGFIGSQVNQLLHDQGYGTIVYDNLTSGNRSTVLSGTFIEGEIADTQKLNDIFQNERIKAVMHFAASTDVGESVVNPEKYYLNNVYNTLGLLEAMRKNKIHHFVFSSSAAVYGIPQREKIRETDVCAPINPYGKTKLFVESILNDYNKAYGLNFAALRYFNAAGGDPSGRIKLYKAYEGNLIPIVLNSIINSSTLTINGSDYPTRDGTCIRDYVHVADLADAHILAMEKLFKEGGRTCYNLGNGQGFSIFEVLSAAEKVTGQKVDKVIGERRPGDPPILLADAAKAHDELRWHPRYPELETIIEHAWQARRAT